MSKYTLKTSCKCGAILEVSGEYESHCLHRHKEFLEAHKVCRKHNETQNNGWYYPICGHDWAFVSDSTGTYWKCNKYGTTGSKSFNS